MVEGVGGGDDGRLDLEQGELLDAPLGQHRAGGHPGRQPHHHDVTWVARDSHREGA